MLRYKYIYKYGFKLRARVWNFSDATFIKWSWSDFTLPLREVRPSLHVTLPPAPYESQDLALWEDKEDGVERGGDVDEKVHGGHLLEVCVWLGLVDTKVD